MTKYTHVVNGVEVSNEDYCRHMEMLDATIAGEQADAEARAAQYELIRPLRPEEVLLELFSSNPEMLNDVSDQIVGRMQPYFHEWNPDGIAYHVGDLVRYGENDGNVYRCLIDHVSQISWTPEDAPSLWAKVLTSSTDILPWEQPSSTNPYMKGDKVIWDGVVWESLIDNNIWMPGVYGWGQIN